MSKALKAALWTLGSVAAAAVILGLFVYRWAGEPETEQATGAAGAARHCAACLKTTAIA